MPDQRRSVAREGLLRTADFTLERAEEGGGDGLTLEGHAAVFNSETLIDSWEGRFKETIAPGAFRKTLRERTPLLQYDHGRHPMVGSIPIGKIARAEEDDHGLAVEARLHDNWLIQPVRDAIASGAVSGMSFRFEVVSEVWTRPDGTKIRDEIELLKTLYGGEGEPPTRTLKEVKVAELGPVAFPAYDSTDVGVRSRDGVHGLHTVVIDLAGLRSNPAERKKLARALWVAEDPNALRDDSEHDESTLDAHTLPAPRPTDDESAGEHADESTTTDAPQVTEQVSAEEHASPAPPTRWRDPLREEVERFRSYVAFIKQKEDSRHGG